MNYEILKKIIQKKEFSNLPRSDVEKVWNLFEKRQTSQEEKIKLTRDLLRKMYFSFSSKKLLNPRIIEKKNEEQILQKHISTKERLPYYKELYKKIVQKEKELTLYDLGCGINGISIKELQKENPKIKYLGIEAVGQLVELQNKYFEKHKIKNTRCIQLSLFEIKQIKKQIKEKDSMIFLFKTLDSLEMLEKDFSKKLLKEIFPLVNKIVISFATSSLISKKKFKVKRYWFENFIKEMNWKIKEDFELGNERYIVIEN
jgi:hypothetical protein